MSETAAAPTGDHHTRRSEMVVRAARPTDAEEVATIVNLPGFKKANLRGPFLTPEDFQKTIGELKSCDRMIVASLDQKLVGFLMLTRSTGRRAHAATIGMGVHDDWVRRGIGKTLLAACIDMADNWFGLRRLALDVAVDNEPAIGLYRSFGFEVEGVLREQAFRDGRYVDGYLMARLGGPRGL